MYGLAGFRRILEFLLAQTALIGVFVASLGGSLFLPERVESVAGRGYAEVFFLLSGAVLMALRFVWPIVADPVEHLWSINSKLRVKMWMQPALLYGAAICLAAGSLLAILGARGGAGWFAFGLGGLGLIAPLGVSTLLSASALRRYRVMQTGVEAMAGALERRPREGLERVRASISTEAGVAETVTVPHPQGFTFAGIASRPWHEREDFPWLAEFEAATDQILEEALAVMSGHGDRVTGYKYPGLEGDQWKSFKFASRHEEVPSNLALCPKTAELLCKIPGYPSFRDAMFSILGPGGVISPHRDVSNVFLTMHLPLVAPGNGFMEVAGMRRPWEKGKALVFDSSYNHQAQNNAGEARIILLVDFLHPELTQTERAWVSEMRL